MPPLVSEGGGLVYESVGGVKLLSDHFDSKQSMEAVDLPFTCHPLVFRSREVRRLLLDLDPNGDTEPLVMFHLFLKRIADVPLGMFPLFLKRTADVLAPHLSVVFRRLVCLGSFPSCCRRANVTQFRKVHPFVDL